MTARVLLVLTSHSELGDTTVPTGVGMETVAGPYYVFGEAGFHVDLGSIAGGMPPIDPLSLGDGVTTASMVRFEADTDAQRQLAQTAPLERIDPSDYDAFFFTGGHGGMWDFPDDPAVVRIVTAALRDGRPVAAVCHGVAALCAADPDTGRALCRGRRLTGLSNREEELLERADVVPFLLTDRLVAAGARYDQAPPFTSHVVVDGPLVTGQNMRSAVAAAQQVVSMV